MNRLAFWIAFLCLPAALAQAENRDGLRDTTVLIVRHAEKPESGFGLTPAGEERARAYVHYFQNLKIDSQSVKLDALFATADSKNSHRPRLTLTPLSETLHLPLNVQ